MADDNKDEPVAVDEKEENKDDGKEENKDDEKSSISFKPERIPKEDPGDGLPTKPTDIIEFKWNKEMKTKKGCDTQHMLYLLQLALNLVRLRTIERNKYFKSIGRTDRYINQLDNPQIITNFLDWHNKAKEKNKFDGELLDKSEKLFMINKMISEIGDTKKGPATKIYTKLKKDVVIETTTWLELPQPKLKLETWGYTKMYKGEKVLDECTVEEMISLLTYVNTEEKDEKQDDKYVQGVFAVVQAQNKKKGLKDDETNWDCIPIYNKTDWKIKRTMAMTSEEFRKRLKKSMNCNWGYNNKWIPLSLQSGVQIVSIDGAVDIGILCEFDKAINKYKPISIHLDGEYLKKYHHISPETNEYNCLDNLPSNITHLSIKNDIDVVASLIGEHCSFSVQDIVEYEVMSFVNEWNNNSRPKSADLENILQCFREHDVMNEYIGKGRRKDLMFMLKHKYEVPKAISSALWIFFTNK